MTALNPPKIARCGYEIKYYTFYIDMPVTDFDYVEAQTQKYTKEYLIAHELTNDKGEAKPHFHFIVKATLKQKNNLMKKILTDKNLFVKGKGGYRPYGCLKIPIRDLNRLKIYCLKEGNVRSNGMDSEELEELSKLSFKKKDSYKILKDKFIKEINTGKFNFPLSPINDWGFDGELKKNIRQYVIQFLLENEQTLLRSSIERWALILLSIHPGIPPNQRSKFLHFFIYN